MPKFIEAPKEGELFCVVSEYLDGPDTIAGPFTSAALTQYLSEWSNNPNDTRLLRVFPLGKQTGYFNKRHRPSDKKIGVVSPLKPADEPKLFPHLEEEN